MKKNLFCILLILSISASYATEPAFELNDFELSQTFKEINELERFVEANPELSFEEVKAENAELLEGISLESESLIKTSDAMPLVGSFWWGCVLGIVGLILVYFVTDNNKEQVKSALIGCVVGTLVFGSVLALTNAFTWF